MSIRPRLVGISMGNLMNISMLTRIRSCEYLFFSPENEEVVEILKSTLFPSKNAHLKKALVCYSRSQR